MAETRWVYVGNLNWFRPALEVENSLCVLLGSISIDHVESASGKSLRDFVETISIVLFAENTTKIKSRDLAKQHQGFALVKFSDCETAKVAANKLVGIELQDGAALGPLRAALSRAKVSSGFTRHGCLPCQ
jgi:RNA recognition motif-containing protein